jgi:hypothetical protein
MGGLYDYIICTPLREPFIQNRFHEYWQNIHAESSSNSIFKYDGAVRGKKLGYYGAHLWYRTVSR